MTISEKCTIKISQIEALEVTAILSHLRQIFNTAASVRDDGRIMPIKPADMDPVELLRCSASMRTLFFDTNPLLIKFIKKHNYEIKIEALETDLNLLFLSMPLKEAVHFSDFFVDSLFNVMIRKKFPINKIKQVLLFYQDREGLDGIMENIPLWMPNSSKQKERNSSVGINSRNMTPSQLTNVTRRQTDLSEWGKIRVGYLKDKPIDRKSFIEYVANWLGGIHYNGKRIPKNKDDKDKFEVLTTAYDIDNQSYMHAGYVMIAIACTEILKAPNLLNLYVHLEDFQQKRIERLAKGDKLT